MQAMDHLAETTANFIAAMGQPLLSDATASFECEIECSQDAGSHRIFIGRVVNAKRNGAEPLIYCNRAFGRVAEL
jgi:flavin reductase